jgi:hypothetical protein
LLKLSRAISLIGCVVLCNKNNKNNVAGPSISHTRWHSKQKGLQARVQPRQQQLL